jgi:hypothetical protein
MMDGKVNTNGRKNDKVIVWIIFIGITGFIIGIILDKICYKIYCKQKISKWRYRK